MTQQTILLIEDSPTTRAILRTMIEEDGYNVIEAGDAVTGLSVLASRRPDLIIQDIVLPDADGLELTQWIRALPTSADVPIVVLSGFAGRLDEARATAHGYAGILLKPVERTALLDVVRAVLPKAPSKRERTGLGRHLLLVDDNQTQRKLDLLRFEQAGFRVTTSPGGKEAVVAVAEVRPDIVVTDVLMPEMDGFELCERLRSNPFLTNLPVVLVSSHYDEEHDVALGRSVGANSFVLRSAGAQQLLDAVFDALESGPPSSVLEIPRDQSGERDRRVITQLDKRLARQARLDERSTQLTAEMSLLSGIADALTRSADMEATLRDIFGATLEAGGISAGALFLENGEGDLTLRYTLGFANEAVADFFGCATVLARAITAKIPITISSTTVGSPIADRILDESGSTSIMIVPLVLEARPVGALVLGSGTSEQPRDGLASFARAVGAQIVQSLALMRAFERTKAAEASLRDANIALEAKVAARTKDLSEANAALAQTVELRQDMIAIVSHDLRNPLNIISLTVHEMLRAIRTPAPVSERDIARVARASNQMKQLITNLLDFSSIEQQSFSVEQRPLKVRRVLEDALDAYLPLAEAKSIRLEISGDVGDGVVGGDAERLLYVFSNLIGNAIKFTTSGGRISLRVAVADERTGWRFSVADTGKGIDEAHLPHIFDRYWQGNAKGRHGVGLGLAIAKGIVEAHGGRIWAESARGEGATFHFTLPQWSDPQTGGTAHA